MRPDLQNLRIAPAPVPRPRYIVEPGRPVATGPTVRLRYIPCSRCGTERASACNLSGCPKLTGD